MPIRSPRGRTAAYRGVWGWPLRSPARLSVTLAVVLVLGVGVSFVSAAAGGSSGGGLAPLPPPGATARTAPSSTVRGTPAPTAVARPTALPPVAELEPSTLPLSQAPADALNVAARWTAAWVRPPGGTTAQQWRDGLRATTTEEFLGLLNTVDPSNIAATRMTGEPRAVRVASRSVQVEVPTDATRLLVLVVATDVGWRVSDYDEA